MDELAFTVKRCPIPADRILRSAQTNSFTLDQFDFKTPVDRSRLYVCPTLTPLYYTETFQHLAPGQARRYNQITALCFGELIAFFEESFELALHGILACRGRAALEGNIRACVEHFIQEEVKHRQMWRHLAQLSEPQWYASAPRQIVQIRGSAQRILRLLTRQPRWFPAVVWVMLALEEHSLEISRRCAKMPADQIEPRYAAVYRAHMEEEARHVQIDWHLLLHLMQGIPPAMRRLNGWLFRRSMNTFFLRPTRAAACVIDTLIGEEPDLRPVRRSIMLQLAALETNDDFRRMMLSPASTPITFALMDRFTELKP